MLMLKIVNPEMIINMGMARKDVIRMIKLVKLNIKIINEKYDKCPETDSNFAASESLVYEHKIINYLLYFGLSIEKINR